MPPALFQNRGNPPSLGFPEHSTLRRTILGILSQLRFCGSDLIFRVTTTKVNVIECLQILQGLPVVLISHRFGSPLFKASPLLYAKTTRENTRRMKR